MEAVDSTDEGNDQIEELLEDLFPRVRRGPRVRRRRSDRHAARSALRSPAAAAAAAAAAATAGLRCSETFSEEVNRMTRAD